MLALDHKTLAVVVRYFRACKVMALATVPVKIGKDVSHGAQLHTSIYSNYQT